MMSVYLEDHSRNLDIDVCITSLNYATLLMKEKEKFEGDVRKFLDFVQMLPTPYGASLVAMHIN